MVFDLLVWGDVFAASKDYSGKSVDVATWNKMIPVANVTVVHSYKGIFNEYLWTATMTM